MKKEKLKEYVGKRNFEKMQESKYRVMESI